MRPATWPLFLLLAACGADAGSSESDVIDGTVAGDYRFAALVDAALPDGTGECSGALIAARVVITAGHCTQGFSSWRVTTPYALDAEGHPASAVASRGETFDWDLPLGESSPERHDIGLLFLDAPIELARYPTIVADDRAGGNRVRYVGRVRDGDPSDTDLFVGPPVTARAGDAYGWPHTFATDKHVEKGDSGGPVVLDDDAQTIVGVDSGGNWELDVELFARADLLEEWIAERLH